MYRSILVPVDGSPFGEHALPQAATIARRSGATLHLAHVHEPLLAPAALETAASRGGWSDATREQERLYLDALVERVTRAHGVQADSRLVDGPIADSLERYATDSGAGLVVMSTHAHSGLSRLWHHGVAGQMGRDLPLPVLLLHARDEKAPPPLEEEHEIRHVLVPLDGSPAAEEILPHAIDLGRLFGAGLTLLQVLKPPMAVGYTLLGQDGHVNHHRQTLEEQSARKYLDTVAERVRGQGMEVRIDVVAGEDPAAAILDYANGAVGGATGVVDLIAMECSPHGAVSRYLTHTADEILKGSPVPVLLLQAGVAHAHAHAESLEGAH